MKKSAIIKKVKIFDKIVADQWVPSLMKEPYEKAGKKAFQLSLEKREKDKNHNF